MHAGDYSFIIRLRQGRGLWGQQKWDWFPARERERSLLIVVLDLYSDWAGTRWNVSGEETLSNAQQFLTPSCHYVVVLDFREATITSGAGSKPLQHGTLPCFFSWLHCQVSHRFWFCSYWNKFMCSGYLQKFRMFPQQYIRRFNLHMQLIFEERKIKHPMLREVLWRHAY